MQDVESIGRGNAAKQRGTGSRRVPHRLNADERKLYELAKQKAPPRAGCSCFSPFAKPVSGD